MSEGRCNGSNQGLTFCRVSSALLAPTERGTLSYVSVEWSTDSICLLLITSFVVASADSEIYVVTGGEAVMQLRLVRDGFIRCMNPLTWSIQSSKLSSISSWSPGCGQCLDNLSGPWYDPGTCTKVKWNMKIDTIHQFMLAEGAISGFDSIPLIYFASTSTIRLQMPIKYILSALSVR